MRVERLFKCTTYTENDKYICKQVQQNYVKLKLDTCLDTSGNILLRAAKIFSKFCFDLLVSSGCFVPFTAAVIEPDTLGAAVATDTGFEAVLTVAEDLMNNGMLGPDDGAA